MPYKPGEATRSIAVEKVTLTLTAVKRWVSAGETLDFSGYLTRDGVGYGGQPVYLQRYIDGVWQEIAGPVTTGPDGGFSFSLVAGYDVACRDIPYRARWEDIYSPEVKAAVAYPTRLSISAPEWVRPGETFTVTGRLELEYRPGEWRPSVGKTINIYYNETQIGTGTTDTDGVYSISVSIPSKGAYTLKAAFEGYLIPGTLLMPSFAMLLMPPGWPPIPDWAKTILDFVVATSPIWAAGVTIAYDALSREGRWPKFK